MSTSIQFPSNPSLNDEYTYGESVYRFNGVSWTPFGSAPRDQITYETLDNNNDVGMNSGQLVAGDDIRLLTIVSGSSQVTITDTTGYTEFSGSIYDTDVSQSLRITTLESGSGFVNITAEQYNLSSLNTPPSSSTDTGSLGEVRISSDYIYVCVSSNTWKRSALTTW